VKQFLRHNGLSLFFGVLLLAALIGQAIAGHLDYNEDQRAHGGGTISLGRYVVSSSYGRAVMENWQSEYLQFFLFILATVWLLQRGSPESKEIGREGLESDEDQLVGEHAKRNSPGWARVGGIRSAIYSNSLLLVMGFIFVASWFAHSVTSWSDYNAEQLEHDQESVSWIEFLGAARFWEQTLENWQSEFLAVGSMVILSVYLRQRGSPESKPVGSSHEATGVEG
jgi:hypothetical protein